MKLKLFCFLLTTLCNPSTVMASNNIINDEEEEKGKEIDQLPLLSSPSSPSLSSSFSSSSSSSLSVSSLSPAHDPHLRSLRLSCYVMWLIIAEFFYFLLLLLNSTVLTYMGHIQMRNRISPYFQGVHSILPVFVYFLYFIPPVVVVVFSLRFLFLIWII